MLNPGLDRGRRRLAALISMLLMVGVVGVAGVVGSVGSPAFAAGAQTVTIGATLSPKDITVAPGTTVTWKSGDGGKHRVRSRSGPAQLDSGGALEGAGSSWTITLTVAGTYAYVDDENKDNAATHGTVTVGAGGSAAGGGGTAPAPTTASVSIANQAFSPASLSVAIGGTVTWTNNDSMAHNVVSTTGAFTSTTLQPGAVFTFTFTTAGTYGYICTFHGGMSGTIIVPTATGSVPAPAAPPPAGAAGGSAAAPAAGGLAKTYQVKVGDNTFTPSSVQARVGDTIVWTNVGRMPHTVTAGNGSFNRTPLGPGQTFSYSLRAQGTVPYVCSFHPGMNGTLVVGAALAGVAVPPASAGATSGGGGAAAPISAAPKASADGKTKIIEIKVNEMTFGPAMANANVGDTISWVNVGKIPHTVTAKDGSFNKTPLAPGERFNFVLRKEGSVSYVCTYHPGMDGMLMVGPALAGVVAPGAAGAGGAAAPALAPPARHGTATTFEVQVKENSFTPATVNARVGDTISWVNVGTTAHTVTAKNHSFDKRLLPGQRFDLVLTKEGTIEYVCTPHQGMFGSVVVGPTLANVQLAGFPLALGGMSTVSWVLLGIGVLLLALLIGAQRRLRAATSTATGSKEPSASQDG